ncbi:uncharacterized protein LOC121859851 [Homarus americanus]|uniref:Uncharacterized protein n=1 Tax=Homarus americanus TaxID=6706 RepID=A0A8J5TCT9_HOMAM|nr:uncharacterized protein LOC121859851 [Homarus americanus]KAG7174000.1 hypothetical protein Hamer_G022224 [Homarus americanus]
MRMQVRTWWCMVTVVTLGWAAIPKPTYAFTLDGYFKVLALAAKKRDIWRKIFLGKDVGFAVSPWLFKDRVKPPFVPIVTTFPRYPVHGHYRNEYIPPPTLPPIVPVAFTGSPLPANTSWRTFTLTSLPLR